MGLPSRNRTYPTLPPGFEHSELRLPAPLRSAPLEEAANGFPRCEVRPLFSSARSEGDNTHSTSTSFQAPGGKRATETPDSSVEEARVGSSKLADLMVAEIDAEIESYQSVEDEERGAWDTSEVDHTEENISEIEYPFGPELAVADANARVQRFKVSYDYLAYANDRSFRERISRTHPHLQLVRAKGRIAAFENSQAYRQHQEDLALILKYGDAYDVAIVSDRELVEKSESKKRVEGRWSKQWKDLGVKGGTRSKDR